MKIIIGVFLGCLGLGLLGLGSFFLLGIRKEHWESFLSLLIILTFICTAIATTYSVITSTKALEQSSIDMRPWIIIPDFRNTYSKSFIETKVLMTNIGKLPAYTSFDREIFIDGQQIKIQEEDPDHEPTIIMPTQRTNTPMITIKGEEFKKILNNKGSKVELGIRIYYGKTKEEFNEKRYFTYYKAMLEPIELIKAVETEGKNTGLWSIVESDYK